MKEPVLLSPAFKDYLWGGTRLKEEYGKKSDLEKVADLAQWKAEGALGLMKKSNGVQAVYGPKADVLKSDINDIL